MAHLRFGIVGVGPMSGVFARTLASREGVSVEAVAASGTEDAASFAELHGVGSIHASVEALAADPDVDAVYVAGPPSTHRADAVALFAGGKHVLVEKPMASAAWEVEAIVEAARGAGRALMELYPAPFEPGIEALRGAIGGLGDLRRAVFVKDQYSSAYDSFKSGELPGAFDPSRGGGSILDLGFYGVSLAVHLFGRPVAVSAVGQLLAGGADGQGSIALRYDGFEVDCLHSKIVSSPLDSQVAGEARAIVLDDIATPRRVEVKERNAQRRWQSVSDLSREREGSHLDYGIDAFLALVRGGGVESDVHPWENSIVVHEVLDEARRQVGVVFPADGART